MTTEGNSQEFKKVEWKCTNGYSGSDSGDCDDSDYWIGYTTGFCKAKCSGCGVESFTLSSKCASEHNTFCGDGVCETGETATSCPDDCEMTGCTKEAKICPDGSSVFRTGINCEFAECPPETDELPAGQMQNGLIALQIWDKNGKLQVFIENSDGTGLTQLTFDMENGRPSWSPDGKKIAYVLMTKPLSEGGGFEAWIMDADGSNKKLLAKGHGVDSWSPDGKKIAYSQSGQIWTMDDDGSNEKQITYSNTFKSAPTWSYDGKQMAFILLKNPTSIDFQPEIGIMNADGTNERILTREDRTNIRTNSDGTTTILETAYDANAPSWSPVENKIAFWSGIETKYGQVWVINDDGTGSLQLTEEPNHRNSDDPSWSPDGKKILFSTGRSGRNELWVMDASGENEKRISDIGANPFPGRASWQPAALIAPPLTSDGLIVGGDSSFVSNDISQSEIYTIRTDGTGKRNLTKGNKNILPAWSYDGKKIVYASQKQREPHQIWIMDADGSNKKQLTFAQSGGIAPAFSPDHTKIIYSSLKTGHPEIWIMDIHGKNQRQLTNTTTSSKTRNGNKIKWGIHGTFSPDGNKIVYASTQSGKSQIWIMDSDGSNQKQLTFPIISYAPDANAPSWSPDGKKIVFWSGYETEYGQLFVMNPDGTNRTQLTFEADTFNSDNPAWSIDGNYILFESDRGNYTTNKRVTKTWIMNSDGSNVREFLPFGYGAGRRPWKAEELQ